MEYKLINNSLQSELLLVKCMRINLNEQISTGGVSRAKFTGGLQCRVISFI